MSQKAHGTSEKPVQQNLRWNVDRNNADRICNFNRHYAEYAGYWKTTNFLKEVSMTEPTIYYDSVTGKPLFVAPIGRTMQEFLAESDAHGWPSFRDQEVCSKMVHISSPSMHMLKLLASLGCLGEHASASYDGRGRFQGWDAPGPQFAR